MRKMKLIELLYLVSQNEHLNYIAESKKRLKINRRLYTEKQIPIVIYKNL